ncbi:MAG TPA: thioredoxin [Gemmatimonadaceae bacterium]|nr:thioredoxin [Gemmatimonadaceae bacterium]
MTDVTATTGAKHLQLHCQFCETWNRVDAARAADRPKCGNCARPMLLDRPYVLTEETFDRTIKESEIPVFVDFYADWCGPCKMIAPAVDELALAFQGRALVAKLDTDRAPAITQRLGIRGIPTAIVFKAGEEFARQTGAVPKQVLEEMLARATA